MYEIDGCFLVLLLGQGLEVASRGNLVTSTVCSSTTKGITMIGYCIA